MPLIKYIEKRFQAKTQNTIDQAAEIITEYQRQGFDLTVRQLYYQFVARGLMDNNQRNYKRLGDIVKNARMAGLLDWYSIVDRTRHLRGMSHWTSPHEIIEGSAASYREQKWSDQPVRVEVWIEKDALVGVIEAICREYDLDYFACRGYPSVSEVWRASRRLRRYTERGQRVVVLHLGDHDPSGLDMTRDIENRLATFGADIEVRRIALTMEQIERYRPPPNPTKMTDSRAPEYVTQYGYESYELDALNPDIMSALIRDEVEQERDHALWAAALEAENEQRELLTECAARWDEVVAFLGGGA